MTPLLPPSTNSLNKKKEKLMTKLSEFTSWKNLKYGLLAIVVFLLAWTLTCIPRYFINASKPIKDDYALTGTIGDTYGGLLGPPIAFIAAILTFAAFWVQYRANQQQKSDIADQKKNWLYERFENRFFELLKLHKENVNEMRLTADITSRECFAVMFEELRDIHEILLKEYKSAGIPPEYQLEVQDEKIAYYILFYGFETTRDVYYQDFNKWEQMLFDNARQELYLRKRSAEDFLEKGHATVKPTGFRGYVFFKGHSDILGHYYRHLHQTAKYVTSQNNLKNDEKYEYIKTLRAQLSNFEQLMLYYNGVAMYPEKWYELFTEYRFIKNIRLDQANLGQPPNLKYNNEMNQLWESKKEKMFENQSKIVAFEPEDESSAPGQLDNV